MASENPNIQIADISQIFSTLQNQQEKNQVRASLFNLVVFSVGPKRTQFLRDIVNMIIERFPCRIFFIQGDLQTESGYLHVTANQERVKKGENYILCDEIQIQASKEYLNRVPYIILPHFVSDLPIFLLWGQDPSQENVVFPILQPYASRLIFDAECSSNLQQFCRTILSHHYQLEVMDLNWALTSGWRRIFAQTFDTEQKFNALCQAKSLKILFNHKNSRWLHQHETQAAYLQGWLASKCNWKFAKKDLVNDNIQLHYTHPHGSTIINLLSQNCEELNPGAILEIELDVTDDLHYHLSRPKNGSSVRVEISSAEKCELPFLMALPNLRGFLQEILYRNTSVDYLKMIKTIEPITWSSKNP
jgi:glucose-6-phosphate dehydrogenase assembly protein OpcA